MSLTAQKMFLGLQPKCAKITSRQSYPEDAIVLSGFIITMKIYQVQSKVSLCDCEDSPMLTL